jgi:hypothetical protein
LPEKFSEELAIRYSLDEDDEDKMRFENLVDQALRLARSKGAILRNAQKFSIPVSWL